jgi:hypothetical protein
VASTTTQRDELSTVASSRSVDAVVANRARMVLLLLTNELLHRMRGVFAYAAAEGCCASRRLVE